MSFVLFFFFFNDTATTEIYTLSLHDALPISGLEEGVFPHSRACEREEDVEEERRLCYVGMTRAKETLTLDRKSTRLNSSHLVISYAVFCLKKKKSMMQVADTQLQTLAQRT